MAAIRSNNSHNRHSHHTSHHKTENLTSSLKDVGQWLSAGSLASPRVSSARSPSRARSFGPRRRARPCWAKSLSAHGLEKWRQSRDGVHSTGHTTLPLVWQKRQGSSWVRRGFAAYPCMGACLQRKDAPRRVLQRQLQWWTCRPARVLESLQDIIRHVAYMLVAVIF